MDQTNEPLPPLGIVTLLSEGFALLISRFGQIFTLALIVSLVGAVLAALIGAGSDMPVPVDPDGTEAPFDPGDFAGVDTGLGGFFLVGFLGFALQVLVGGLISGMLALIALDATTETRRPLGDYAAATLARVVPIAVLTLVVSIAAGIGLIFLILPGLWIYAVWSVIVPVIMVESAGFGALGRSAKLTENYRWPIIGLVVVIILFLILVSLVVLLPVGALVAAVGPDGLLARALFVLFDALATAIGAGYGACVTALLYLRLRELKGAPADAA